MLTITGSGGGTNLTADPAVNISHLSGNQSEANIAIDPTNTQRMFAVSNRSSGSGMFAAYSTNGGTSWTTRTMATGGDGLAAACCDGQLAWDAFGNLFVVYIDSGVGNIIVGLSTNGGQTFTQILAVPGSVDQPSIAVGAGSVWIDWNDSGSMKAKGAAVTGLGSVGAFGATQNIPSASGSFGSIAVNPVTGAVMVNYQDNSGGEGPENIYCNTDADGLGAGGFSARRTITSTNVGSFDYIPAQAGRSVDAESNLTYDQLGRAYLVYTDEATNESNNMDVYVRTSDNDGTSWSARVKVNDDATTRSQFMTSIAADPVTGYVGVSWYDCRNSAGNNTAQFWASASVDRGATWLTNVTAGPGFSNSATSGNGIDYGDYMGTAYVGGNMFPIWADNSNSTGDNPNGAGAALDIYTAKLQVTITGGGVTVTCTGTAGVDTYNIRLDAAGTTVQFWENDTTMSGAPDFAVLLADLNDIVVNTLGGNDNLFIVYTNGNPIPVGGITYDGGTNTDTLTVVNGTPSTDTLTVTTATSGTLNLGTLGSIPFTNTETISDTLVFASYTVTGAAGAETLNIVDGPTVNALATTQVNNGASPAFPILNFANKATLTIDGTGGADTINLNNPNAGAGITTINIQSGGTNGDVVNVLASSAGKNWNLQNNAGTDTINFGNAGNMQSIAGTITITSPGGLAAVVMNDTVDVSARTPALGSSSVTGLAPATINFTGSELSALTISGGSGGNTVTVNDTIAGITTTLNSGNGIDTVQVNATTGQLNVNLQNGDDTLAFANGANLSGGSVDGGTGNNALSYTAWTTQVIANLGPDVLLVAVLDGAQETPPNGSAAVGTGFMTFNQASDLFDMGINVTGILLADVTNSHIHRAAVGVAGPAVFTLGNSSQWSQSGSEIIHRRFGSTFPAAEEANLLANLTYINVHTTAVSGGEIRGQLLATMPGTAPGVNGITNIQSVVGGSDDDVLVGSTTANALTGGAGLDTLLGGDGNDTLDGGAGNDILWGGNGIDRFSTTLDAPTFTLTNTSLSANGETDELNSIDEVLLTGGGSANVFDTLGFTLGNVTVNGAGGTDTLIGPSVNSTWNITSAGGGNVNGTIVYSNMENLTGGTANDIFKFSAGVGVAGTVSGGAGTNTLDYSLYSTAVAINLQANTATGTGGISGFRNFIAGSATNDSIIASTSGGTVTWHITSNNTGNNDATIDSYQSFESLTGSAANDIFQFNAGVGQTGTIDGSGGTNTLDYTAYITAVTFNLLLNTATSVGTIANINAFNGGSSANDSLIGPNTAATWSIIGANVGNRAGTFSFAGVENLTGGTNNDVFTFSNGAVVAGTIAGGGGNDTLNYAAYTTAINVNFITNTATATGGMSGMETVTGGTAPDQLVGPNGNATWNLTANNSGNRSGTLFWTNIENLTMGTGQDNVVFSNGVNVSGVLDGGPGIDSLDYSAYTTSVSVNFVAGTATGTGGIVNFEGFTGGSGIDTLNGPDLNTNWNITGPGSGNIDGTTPFNGVENIQGGSQNDTFVFGSSGSLTGTINGGGGIDTLDYSTYGANIDANLGTKYVFFANLTGGQEVPPNGSGAIGAALLVFDQPTLTFELKMNVVGIPIGDVTAAHIHVGAPGVSGSAVFDLGDSTSWAALGGGITRNLLDAVFPPANAVSLLAGNTYVNVHTTTFGGAGEIRGQLILVAAPSTATGVSGIANIENVTGGNGNDAIFGDDFNNMLNGGAGADTINGALGTDSLDGGTQTDLLFEVADVANLILTDTTLTSVNTKTATNFEEAWLGGGAGANVINASNFTHGPVSILGGAGDDLLTGTSATDFLFGGDDNDSLAGGAAVDYFDGGTGSDRLDITADLPFLSINNTTVNAGDVETLNSIERAQLTGGVANNSLDASGFTGDATLIGGFGNDTLVGGPGSDDLSGGDGSDFINGNGGTDRLVETADVNFTLKTLTLTNSFLQIDTLAGIERALLTGGPGNNLLNAKGFAFGSVTLIGAGGNDVLTGTKLGDMLDGGAGSDNLKGRNGNDTLTGGDSNDTLSGGKGLDLVIEAADASFTATNVSLAFLGFLDRLAGVENLSLTGGDSNNSFNMALFTKGGVTINGGLGNDTLTGGSKNDSLFGGEGDDNLDGGLGFDILDGGNGTDTGLNGETVSNIP